MIHVHQVPGDKKCLSACIASILHLTLGDVPRFEGNCREQRERANAWLAPRGRGLVLVEGVLPSAVPQGFFVIASGPSPRTAPGHAVLMAVTDGALLLAHDPHPSGDGLAGDPDSLEVVVVAGRGP